MNTVLEIITFIIVLGMCVIFLIGFSIFFYKTVNIICEGEIINTILKLKDRLNTNPTIGSKWRNGRYEVIKTRKILPESLRIVEPYTSEKDLITIIYVRDLETLEVSEYKLSEFKKWFRK